MFNKNGSLTHNAYMNSQHSDCEKNCPSYELAEKAFQEYKNFLCMYSLERDQTEERLTIANKLMFNYESLLVKLREEDKEIKRNGIFIEKCEIPFMNNGEFDFRKVEGKIHKRIIRGTTEFLNSQGEIFATRGYPFDNALGETTSFDSRKVTHISGNRYHA